MIINGTNVRGIWNYENGLIFEPSDFVVKDDQIYICTKPGTNADVLSRNDGSWKNCFKRYPGNMIDSLEQYKEIVSDPEIADDLYVSSKVLHAILQDSYFGLGDSGIIDSRIESDGSLKGQIDRLVRKTDGVLDDLLSSEGFNNGVVLVSRDLPEIKALGIESVVEGAEEAIEPVYKYRINPDDCIFCGSCVDLCPTGAISMGDISYVIGESLCTGCGLCYCTTEAISRYVYTDSSQEPETNVESEEEEGAPEIMSKVSSGIKSDYVLLRQYTYRSGATGYLNRIQELVDPVEGLIFFRSASQKSISPDLTLDSTGWKSCLSESAKKIEYELEKLREYLGSSSGSETELGGFRFKSLDFQDGNNEYSINAEDINFSGELDGTKGIVTVIVEMVSNDGKIHSYSSTMDLLSAADSDGGITYGINKYVDITLTKESGPIYSFLLSATDQARDLFSSIIIKDIYCREAC